MLASVCNKFAPILSKIMVLTHGAAAATVWSSMMSRRPLARIYGEGIHDAPQIASLPDVAPLSKIMSTLSFKQPDGAHVLIILHFAFLVLPVQAIIILQVVHVLP